MKRFEYKVYRSDTFAENKKVEAYLNKLGRDGWRITNSIKMGTGDFKVHHILMREMDIRG